MDSELQKIITERTRALPSEVKKALQQVDVQKLLVAIAQESGLRIDQAGTLETEVLLTILGIQPTTSFVGNLKQHASLSPDDAEKVAALVNERVFKAIRLEMASAQHQSQPQQSAQPTPAPQAAQPALATGATPAPEVSRAPEKDIVQKKLEGSFRLTPDKVVLKQSIDKGSYPAGSDPYREPIA